MVAFKVLIFALTAISAAPAEESADYFVMGVFDPSTGNVINPNPDVRALPHWGPNDLSANYFARYPWYYPRRNIHPGL
jgi:hypothetical protein